MIGLLFAGIIASLICATFVLYIYMKLKRYDQTFLPAPEHNWLLGDIEFLKHASNGARHVILANNVKKYGNVYTLQLPFGEKAIVVGDHAIAKKLWLAKGAQEKPPLYQEFRWYDRQGTKRADIFSSETSSTHWNYHRKGLARFFTPRNLNKKADYMLQYTVEAVDSMIESKVDRFVMESELIDLTIRVIGKSGYDYDFDRIDGGIKHLSHLISAVVREMTRRTFQPYRNFMFWTKEYQDFFTYNKELSNIMEIVLNEYRKNHPNWKDESECTELLGYLLRCKNPETGEYNSDDVNINEMLIFLVAGHDTTGHSLSWVLYNLSKHPKAESEVFSEIRSILGDRRAPTVQEVETAQTPMLDAFVEESMRLFPVAAGGSARLLTDDVKINDQLTLKKGITCFLPLIVINRDEKVFEDPDTFNPYRFKDPAVMAKARKDKLFLGFAAGKRDCIGKRFAMMEMKAVLMTLVRNLKFELLEEPEIILELTLHSKNGLIMKPIARQEGQ